MLIMMEEQPRAESEPEPQLPKLFDRLMGKWKGGELTYEEAVRQYVAKAIEEIEDNH